MDLFCCLALISNFGPVWDKKCDYENLGGFCAQAVNNLIMDFMSSFEFGPFYFCLLLNQSPLHSSPCTKWKCRLSFLATRRELNSITFIHNGLLQREEKTAFQYTEPINGMNLISWRITAFPNFKPLTPNLQAWVILVNVSDAILFLSCIVMYVACICPLARSGCLFSLLYSGLPCKRDLNFNEIISLTKSYDNYVIEQSP